MTTITVNGKVLSPWSGVRKLAGGTRFCVPLEHGSERCEDSSHPCRGADLASDTSQAYAKNAYAWLMSQHASGVHGLSGFTEMLRRNCDDGGDQLLGFDRFA